MKFVMSPARNIRPAEFPGVRVARPQFLEEAYQLVEVIRDYAPYQLESLLDLNEARALDLYHAYRAFDPEDEGTPALASYYGAAYQNLNLLDFTGEDFAFAQEHLRIFSALYGILRPSDGILVHRLGLISDLRIDGQDLLGFWGNKVYEALYRETNVVVGLCSNDYAKLLMRHLRARDTYIDCRFLIQKPDGARGTVSTIRAARGQMARFLVKERVDEPEGLKDFTWDGYRFIPGRSTLTSYVFIRDW